ncbi:hypothetical protein [Lysobacter tyrosinilyticus]
MKRLYYPGTDIEVRIGDLVRWFDDNGLSKVIFIISTDQFPEDDPGSTEWFKSEFGEGIMIDTPDAGLVLESEDCRNITLVRSAGERA